MPDHDCRGWVLESNTLIKEEMSEQDWLDLKLAMERHLAVCERCQKYEAKVYTGRSGQMTVRLFAHIAEEVQASMGRNGFPLHAQSEVLTAIAFEVTKVLEQWKLIKFEENMLAVREQWAANTKTKGEKEEEARGTQG